MEPDDDVVGEHSHRPLKKVHMKLFTLLIRRVSQVKQVGAAKLVSLAEQVGLASLVRLVWKLVSLSSKACKFSSWTPILQDDTLVHMMVHAPASGIITMHALGSALFLCLSRLLDRVNMLMINF